ncbi:MAG: hypothetical protein KJ058_11335 [Thermoanaerobaculia bacterium]|nr:hypothetical protein [Thermoanaerobaculia bacterium]MCZ7651000.1 hypothetical protein [Thermoanaerobaculia bacterium]
MNRIAILVAALLLVTAGLLAGAPPQPTPQTGPALPPRPPGGLAPVPTGYDVAVVWFSSTGPQGTPHDNAPVVVIENKGTRAVDRHLALEISANGQMTARTGMHVLLQPGQRQTWTGGPTDRGLYPWGTVAQAKIDAGNELREDNETNNTFSRTLQKVFPGHEFHRP